MPSVSTLSAFCETWASEDFDLNNRDRGEPHSSTPPTPPDMRVRIRRFGGLSHKRSINRGIPSESKYAVGSAI